jgi:hypothetical protein
VFAASRLMHVSGNIEKARNITLGSLIGDRVNQFLAR